MYSRQFALALAICIVGWFLSAAIAMPPGMGTSAVSPNLDVKQQMCNLPACIGSVETKYLPMLELSFSAVAEVAREPVIKPTPITFPPTQTVDTGFGRLPNVLPYETKRKSTEQTVEHVAKQITAVSTANSPAPKIPFDQLPKTAAARRELAHKLTAEARKHIADNRLDEAEHVVYQLRELAIDHYRSGDEPSVLQREIDRRRELRSNESLFPDDLVRF